MELCADMKSLVEALDQVHKAVGNKSTIPILSHVLVEASSVTPECRSHTRVISRTRRTGRGTTGRR